MQKQNDMNAAQIILEDRRGANFYEDTRLLSKFLEGTLDLTKDKAEQTAKAIQEDRCGANYYEC